MLVFPGGKVRAWWKVFNDPILESLMDRAVDGNLDLRQAYARIKEARAIRALPEAEGRLIVTPGVRPVGAALGDQKRVMPPVEAIAEGLAQGVVRILLQLLGQHIQPAGELLVLFPDLGEVLGVGEQLPLSDGARSTWAWYREKVLSHLLK